MPRFVMKTNITDKSQLTEYLKILAMISASLMKRNERTTKLMDIILPKIFRLDKEDYKEKKVNLLKTPRKFRRNGHNERNL